MSVADRVAKRALAASEGSDLAALLKVAQDQLRKLKAWSRGFPAAMREAQKDTAGLPAGYVWQDELVEFWKPFYAIEKKLVQIEDDIEDRALTTDKLHDLWTFTEDYLSPYPGARIEDAIAYPRFFDRPNFGKYHIAYSVKTLESWHAEFSKWVDYGIRGIGASLQKVRRL